MAVLAWPSVVLPDVAAQLVLGSFGASAALIFAAPESPLSQPRNVGVGHAVSALAGVAGGAFAAAVGAPALAAPTSVALAVAAMVGARALHPPAAGTAILAAGAAPLGIAWLLPFLGVQSALLVAAGAAFGAAVGRPYPRAGWRA